ncbi:hypothetical protein [Spirosoma sordidisoli]|uniref:Uncharacterized protein n=1 Tax=Spirosoma sordidisoli TaxID=2502893 RepID=A0A4Q2UC42_9BACT|nr:hypothetical protein [Spirosoma sordidisoli]RYC66557.1 hypothetical protein EQG79_28595 [Spirosoma sordidisoli]
MKNNNNDQFPPVSPNGTGAAHRTKRNGSTSPAEEATQEEERTKHSKPTDTTSRCSPDQRTRPAAKPEQKEDLKPAQFLSAKISTYIAKYPFQTIGGLLAVLLVVVLFKTFYQGKNWKAKRMAEEAYFVANQYARNNGTNLHPYLSRSFRKEVRQLPGLLPLSMQTATRGGTITGAESVGLREVTTDSVVVEVALRYENGREEKRYQPLVYEKEQWRLGLTYSK